MRSLAGLLSGLPTSTSQLLQGLSEAELVGSRLIAGAEGLVGELACEDSSTSRWQLRRFGGTARNLRGARNLGAFAFVIVWGVMTLVASRVKRRTQTRSRGALWKLGAALFVQHRGLLGLACREAGKLRGSISIKSGSAPGHLNATVSERVASRPYPRLRSHVGHM
jgi:hypothetical protein